MRPLQLLPLSGTEFPIRYETSAMRSFQTEVSFCVPSTVASRNCSVEEQFHDTTVHQRGKALGSCVAQLLRCVAQLLRCVAHLFLVRNILNSCVAQLLRCVTQLLRCATQLFFRMRNLGKLRGATVEMRDAAVVWPEVDLGKARAGGSSTDASAFWDLLESPMCARVVAAGFGDYAAGLRRTQPRFPPAMRYALMEQWNDYTHTFVFGFGEMTLAPADYTAIIGLRFTGLTKYTAQGCVSYEVVYCFRAERIRTRLAAWRELPADVRPTAPAYTREERDQAAWSAPMTGPLPHWLTSTMVLMYGPDVVVSRTGSSSDHLRCGPTSTASTQAVRVVILRLTPGGFLGIWRIAIIPLPVRRIPITRVVTKKVRLINISLNKELNLELRSGRRLNQARLPEVLEYTQERKKHRTAAHYRAEAEAEAEAAAPARPARAVLGDVPFPPGMEVTLDLGLGLGSAIIIPADLRQAPPPPQLDPEHATHISSKMNSLSKEILYLGNSLLNVLLYLQVPAQRYQELCQRFEFARSYVAQLYSERHERDLEIGRLRRHQSRQSGAMARLQMEVDRLRTVLEVEGVPLDFSEEDGDGSSSDDAPPSPPPQAAAGPSRRHR
ncbi:hypothetical protein JCGZ_06039 [Jatropha curcas]|uniref:Aminotransferase-like plant mobile domain-containing protein n=1 Tax=Jatropha curcas TaxID=180498 RepID=A0A067KQ07_JATCU|nr:hypothetical protein JCGZ_06039 [Jatropha curcas]